MRRESHFALAFFLAVAIKTNPSAFYLCAAKIRNYFFPMRFFLWKKMFFYVEMLFFCIFEN